MYVPLKATILSTLLGCVYIFLTVFFNITDISVSDRGYGTVIFYMIVNTCRPPLLVTISFKRNKTNRARLSKITEKIEKQEAERKFALEKRAKRTLTTSSENEENSRTEENKHKITHQPSRSTIEIDITHYT